MRFCFFLIATILTLISFEPIAFFYSLLLTPYSLLPTPFSQKMPKKIKFPYLLGSQWTAQRKIDGWRHFRVVNRKNQGKWVYAEMVAACDPDVRFWVNARLLQDRSQWEPGWQSLQEMSEPDACLRDRI